MSKTDPSGFRGSFKQVSVTEATQSVPVLSNRLKHRTMCKSGCSEASGNKTRVQKLQKRRLLILKYHYKQPDAYFATTHAHKIDLEWAK